MPVVAHDKPQRRNIVSGDSPTFPGGIKRLVRVLELENPNIDQK